MHTMHLLPSVAKQPNLELKTQPKQLLGSLPLVIALLGVSYNSVALWQDSGLIISWSWVLAHPLLAPGEENGRKGRT